MTIAALKKKIHVQPIGDVNETFVYLMKTYGVRPIKSQKDHAYYLELSKDLMKQVAADTDGKSMAGMRQYLSLLGPYIENYEANKWPANKVAGGEMLEYLRKQHELTQKDLKKEIGEQPYVSDIEKGKKPLSALHIKKLCRKFGVSPSVFFD